MLADSIDFGDGRARMHQSTIGRDQIVQGNLIVNWLLNNRRSSATEQKNHQRRRGLRTQRFQNSARRVNGFSIGCGMSAAKITEAAHLRRRLDRTRHNTLERSRADLLCQRLHHRMSGFADGNHQHARIRMQIVKVLADAQHPALTIHMPRKCLGNRSLGQRVAKDFPGRITHLLRQLTVVHKMSS